ncbi:MAG: hypothetical protein ACFB4I_11965 [Cyanophyceae cyanobacterium]
MARQGREDIAILVEETAKQRVEQSEKFNQFYEYQLTADSDRLNLLERLIKLEKEVE